MLRTPLIVAAIAITTASLPPARAQDGLSAAQRQHLDEIFSQRAAEEKRKTDAANSVKEQLRAQEEIIKRRMEAAEEQRQHFRELQQANEAAQKAAAELRAQDEVRRKEGMRRQAIINARPESQLMILYTNYIMVRRCHDAREGYAVVFVNDIELDRARVEIKVLTEKLKRENPSLIDGDAWSQANDKVDQYSQDMDVCHNSLVFLDRKFRLAEPEEARTKEDF